MSEALELRAGQKLRSAVSEVQLIVVRAPSARVDLRCGGVPVLAEGEEPPGAASDGELGDELLIGKRYADDELGIELLCTASGRGDLTADGRTLPLKGAKPLPSSD